MPPQPWCDRCTDLGRFGSTVDPEAQSAFRPGSAGGHPDRVPRRFRANADGAGPVRGRIGLCAAGGEQGRVECTSLQGASCSVTVCVRLRGRPPPPRQRRAPVGSGKTPLEPVGRARRPRHDRLAVQMPLPIRRQSVGRLEYRFVKAVRRVNGSGSRENCQMSMFDPIAPLHAGAAAGRVGPCGPTEHRVQRLHVHDGRERGRRRLDHASVRRLRFARDGGFRHHRR